MEGENAFYKRKLLLSIFIPAVLVVIMWIVTLAEFLFEADFTFLGIYPLTLKGIPGILLSPFIHSGPEHLFNNTVSFFFLSVLLFYFYSEVAVKVLLLIYMLTGTLVWIFGREAWHIGASGIIYGLASFLFFSGIIRKHIGLTALSLLIVFLYGSMIWGMVPLLYINVSWESHMLGVVSGVLLAVWFRNEGPRRPVYAWMNEDESESDDSVSDESVSGESDSKEADLNVKVE